MLDRLLGVAVAAPVHAGRPGRELGARVDLVTSTGVRSSWRRRRQEPQLRAHRGSVYEALWREAADALGASVRPASSGLLEIRLEGRTTWVYQQEVALDPAVTIRASLEKSLAHELLTKAGIPVPDHVLCDVRRPGPALRFLHEHPDGVVVKPAGGTGGGIGTTAGVRTDLELRRRSVDDILAVGFDGHAVGGLSVGEERGPMFETLAATVEMLPADRPRYLMGVGDPQGLVEGIALGVDMFDCVLPTRLGRTGAALVPGGRINLRNAGFAADPGPLVEGCTCPACTGFSRAYIRHLIMQSEITGLRLLTIHNLHHLLDLMARARAAVAAGRFAEFRRELAS